MSKVAHGRPTEGIIASIKPNSDFPLAHQTAVEIIWHECVGNIKFGNGGGVGGDEAVAGSAAKRSAQHNDDDSDVGDRQSGWRNTGARRKGSYG